MLQNRVIPVLLISDGRRLVKSIQFKKPTYIGDPVNAVKIFNEKEVDEIVVLDIEASKNNKSPDFDYIRELAGECFMPLSYGGGIRNIQDIRKILRSGVEKVVLNSVLFNDQKMVKDAVEQFGSSTIVASVDVKKNWLGKYRVYHTSKSKLTNHEVLEFVKEIEKLGVGEIMINSVDRDGCMTGYDIDLIQQLLNEVEVPVIVCGGAEGLEDFKKVFKIGVSAAAAGSAFVFKGKHRAVLISYPDSAEINAVINEKK